MDKNQKIFRRISQESFEVIKLKFNRILCDRSARESEKLFDIFSETLLDHPDIKIAEVNWLFKKVSQEKRSE